MWNKIFFYLKEILFPVECVQCGVEGEWWCKKCRRVVSTDPIFVCPICAMKTMGGAICPRCCGVSHLSGARAWYHYDEHNAIGTLIKQFKYHFARDISDLWRELIVEHWSTVLPDDFITGSVLVVPVPLHPRRWRERGFNQAEILAQIIFEQIKKHNLNCVLDTVSLKRTRYTAPQAHLARSERLNNLKNAFDWQGDNITMKKVLLIDDVLTTGATTEECARILRAHGACEVWAITLARG